jgi:hypothetical protein
MNRCRCSLGSVSSVNLCHHGLLLLRNGGKANKSILKNPRARRSTIKTIQARRYFHSTIHSSKEIAQARDVGKVTPGAVEKYALATRKIQASTENETL